MGGLHADHAGNAGDHHQRAFAALEHVGQRRVAEVESGVQNNRDHFQLFSRWCGRHNVHGIRALMTPAPTDTRAMHQHIDPTIGRDSFFDYAIGVFYFGKIG